MASPNLTEAMVRQHAADSFSRGQEYYRQGAVVSLVRRGDTLDAEVEGSAPMPYRVVVTFDAVGVAAATCSCPYTSGGYGGWCKHIVAALLTYINRPEQVEERPPLADLLTVLDHAALRDLLLDLAAHDPDLVDRIEARLPLLATASGAAQSNLVAEPQLRRIPIDVKAVRRQVRAALRDESSYDHDYYDDGGVVDATRGTVDQVWAYLKAGDALSALAVLEVLIEEYIDHKQAEDIMNGGKAQYYHSAAQWLVRARDAYRVADREPEWRAYRAELLVQHARKYKLVPLIKALT